MPRIRPVGVECQRPRPRARSVSGRTAAVGLFAITCWACAPGTAMERSPAGSHATRNLSRVLGDSPVRGWVTTADAARRVAPVVSSEIGGGAEAGTPVVALDPSVTFQQIDGFGGAVLESSVRVLDALPEAKRDAALRALFDPVTGAGFSYVRIALGASDFARTLYTYDDVPRGQTDLNLSHFSLARDDELIVPMLRDILRINANVLILASPWSAPAWMKDSGLLGGGGLRREYYDVYARYLVKAVKAYAARGIPIDTITVANEPQYSDPNYPTMTLTPADEATLIGSYVGPAFERAKLDTKILGYDHNYDVTQYATALLSDPAAARYIVGTSWHCYSGDVAASATVNDAFPGKAAYLTECSGRSWAPEFGSNFEWNVEKILGAVTHASRTVVMGNIALDPLRGPHVRNGCPDCRSILTVHDDASVTQNPEYDVLAQLSKVALPGAQRVGSPWDASTLETLAFVNRDGSHAIVIYNAATTEQRATITDSETTFTVTLPAGALASYLW